MVSIHMVDIVTVVFQDELEVLRLQAQSLDLYGCDIQNIFVIVNEDSDLAKKINTAWWGSLSSRVAVLTRNEFGNSWADNGWVSQQALKLSAAARCESPWSIILDAKTIFVKSMPVLKSQPQVGLLPIYPVFEPSQRIVNQLFDIHLDAQLGPGGVPFVINTDQVKEMIAWIENRQKESFATWFQDQGMLTEFLLYAGWLVYNTGGLDRLYDIKNISMTPCNLCHSEVGAFDRKFAEMQSTTTVSIHRRAWSQLNNIQQGMYLNFLRERGIQ
jgi:hypothetical protein